MLRPVPEVPGKYPDAHMFGCILPAFGLYARHVDCITFDNVTFPLAPGAIDSREPVVLDDVAVCNRPQMRFSSATAN